MTQGNELQAISTGIIGEKPSDVRDLLVFADRHSRSAKARFESLQRKLVSQPKRRVRLLGRAERLLHTDVQLLRAAFEPCATTGRQSWGLGKFGQSKQLAEESTRLGLATRGCRKLHVIDALELAHGESLRQSAHDLRPRGVRDGATGEHMSRAR